MSTQHCLNRKSTIYFLISFGIFLFILPLLHAWMGYPLGIESPLTSYAAIGGILPHSDAADYYTGAKNFLDVGELNVWNTRRPLNALLFAMRLWISQHNFQIALLIQALFSAFSCLLVTASIWKSFGKVAALITFSLLYFFAIRYIPTTLSENLGLTLGSLAFFFLWQSLINQSRSYLFFGTFLLTIGLNARAGAFLVLPLLVLWMARIKTKVAEENLFKGSVFQKTMPVLIGIITGFLFNFLLIYLYSNHEGAPHSNFSFTLFGLVAGGKGWQYVFKLYPELLSQTEPLLAKIVYEKAFALFLEKPWLLPLGYLKSLLAFMKSLIYIFQFSWAKTIFLKLALRLLGIIFIGICIYRFKKLYTYFKKEMGLLNIVLLGMFLSAGFVWKDGDFRLFATTIPFAAAALGITLGSFYFLKPYPYETVVIPKLSQTPFSTVAHFAWVFSLLLLLTGFLGPSLPNLIKQNNAANTITTPLTTEKIFSCKPGESLLIVKQVARSPHIHLNSSASLFKQSLENGFPDHIQPFLKILEPRFLKQSLVLALVYDSQSRQSKYILAPSELFHSSSHSTQNTTRLCGVSIRDAEGIQKITRVLDIP